MKKKKPEKSKNQFQEENKPKMGKKDIIQSIGTYQDFIIMEKKDKIPENNFEPQNEESEDNFLKDFLIMNHRKKQDKSRFSEFFKEISEKEKEKEKKDKIEIKEEPKIENPQNIIINNPPPPNNRFDSYDISPNNNNFYQNNILQKNLNIGEQDKNFNNNLSKPNSRLPSVYCIY